MEVLRSISLYCEAKQIAFLVAGGHAVNAFGISRQTGDLDLIVSREQKSPWLELLEKLKYTCFQNDDRFARFKADTLAAWPIDLMFVDSSTFSKLLNDSILVDYGLVSARTVSAVHLATLKIHALKHYQAHREAKDYGDLLGLLRTGKAQLTNDELRGLCLRYANQALYDRLARDLSGSER